jgi:hypothetical protein
MSFISFEMTLVSCIYLFNYNEITIFAFQKSAIPVLFKVELQVYH